MKIEARGVAGFLRNPGACRVVLLFGEDLGAIRERAEGLTRLVAGSLDDPFRVAVLDREAHGRLLEEASAISMLGGRRVVRVRDVTDSLAHAVERILALPGDSLVVLEAPDLATRSKLRTLLEKHPAGAALGAYHEEGRDLEATIASALAADQITIEADARTWLASQLGADKALTRAELEKLALYVGPGGTATLEAAQASVGDGSAVTLDDVLTAATAGQVGEAGRALATAMAEGSNPVACLRALLMHLQRLHRMRATVDSGQSIEQVMAAQRPPIFFKRAPTIRRALAVWNLAALGRAMQMVFDAENACKRTGAPAEAICEDAVQRIALGARGLGKG